MPSVAYLGPPGTYSHDAAIKAFSDGMYYPKNTLWGVVEAVHKGDTEYGVLPLENSTNGSVVLAIDSLIHFKGPVRAVREIRVSIEPVLYAKEPLKNVTKIYTHPQVWGQVATWLKRWIPDVERIDTSSTARAVELYVKEPNGSAAIAGRAAGLVHGILPFEGNIADKKGNTTRFLLLQHVEPSEPWGDGEHVLLTLEVPHDEPGSLASALAVFKTENLNLCYLTSRPAQRDWTYVWLVEVTGSFQSAAFQQALKRLKELADVRILGTYTRYEHYTKK